MSARLGRIRLVCIACEEQHYGIAPHDLAALVKDGWREIVRVQTYAQSIKVYEDPAKAPPGYSVFFWWTHEGFCPECAPEYAGHGLADAPSV